LTAKYTHASAWDAGFNSVSKPLRIDRLTMVFHAEFDHGAVSLFLKHSVDRSLFSSLPMGSLIMGLARIKFQGKEHSPDFTLRADRRRKVHLATFELRKGQPLDFKVEVALLQLSSLSLNYILLDPDVALASPQFKNMSFDAIELLLSHDELMVRSEDQALEIASAWLQKSRHADPIRFLDAIRWDFVTISGLMHIINTYPAIKSTAYFQEIFKFEL
jgi:hypothetical protein